MTLVVCITSAQHRRNCLRDSRSIKGIELTPMQYFNTWWEQIEDKMATAHHLLFHPLERAHILSSAEERARHGEKKKNSITQRLEKQARELLGRRDCHVCINRHWFFCPALAPQPFILSFVVGAQRGWRNSVTVQLGPWGLCVRIDFTCKRGEGLEPLNKGRLCHQRAGWVKSHWMDNDTYCGKRGRMRDTQRRNTRKGRNDWYCGRRRERERRCLKHRGERMKEAKKRSEKRKMSQFYHYVTRVNKSNVHPNQCNFLWQY